MDLDTVAGVKVGTQEILGAGAKLEGGSGVCEGRPALGLDGHWEPAAQGSGKHCRRAVVDLGALSETLGK
jgi:hypothetical protein